MNVFTSGAYPATATTLAATAVRMAHIEALSKMPGRIGLRICERWVSNPDSPVGFMSRHANGTRLDGLLDFQRAVTIYRCAAERVTISV